MITVYDVQQGLGLALAADEDVQAWSQAYYEKSLTIQVNSDPRAPINPQDCPLVAILLSPEPARLGVGDDRYYFPVQIQPWLADERLADADSGETTIRTFLGGKRLTELAELIRGVAADFAKDSEADLERMDIGFPPDAESYPLIYGVLDVGLSWPHVIGSWEPTLTTVESEEPQ